MSAGPRPGGDAGPPVAGVVVAESGRGWAFAHRPAEGRVVSEFLTSLSDGPCALIVEGEPGIGKTTLWSAAAREARDRGFQVLVARGAAPESVIAYAGLADLLRGVEAHTCASLPDPQRLAVDRILLRAGDTGAATDQRAVAAAFRSVVESLAEQAPVLVAIDDMQWLDPSSAQVVGFAARRLAGPVGILVTVRTGANEPSLALSLQLPVPDRMRRIRLGSLTFGALHEVVSQRLGRSFPRPTMVRIHEVSGGNPFYAIELARGVNEQSAGQELSLPNTLAEVVRARIGAVDGEVRDVLLAVACLAAPTFEYVEHVTNVAPDHLTALLEHAEAEGILLIEGNRLRFTHPLLARGVYDAAGAGQRRGMHRRLAEVVDQPELRARHLALGATRGDPLTLQALDVAAETARIRGAPAAAAELLELAIGLGGDTPQRRIRAAANHFHSGDAARARTELDTVVAGDPPRVLRAEALSLLGVMSQLEVSLLDAAKQFGRALDDAGDNLELRARILTSLAWVQIRIGQHAASAHSIEDAVADAQRLGRSQLLSEALGMHVVVHVLLGNGLDNSILRRALAMEGPPAAATAATLRPSFHRAMVMAWTGQFDAAHEQFVAVRQNCVERGEESDVVFVSFHYVLNEIWRAEFSHATLIAEDTVERALQLDGALQVSTALIARAMVAAYAGRENDARLDAARAIGPISRSGSQLLTTSAVATLGFLEVSLGNYEAAVTTLEPLLGIIDMAPEATEIFVAGFVPDAVEALVHLGRYEDAEPLVDALERNGRRLDRAWMRATGARCRGLLLAAHGELDAATDAAESALREHDRLPMPFERARTQMLCGELQRRQRHWEAAAACLQEVAGVFESLNTPLWAARARAALARTNVGAGRGAGLSESERRVAELAASGVTNRDIAAALFISAKTVEATLSNVYRKLGIRSRAELGRRLDQLEQ